MKKPTLTEYIANDIVNTRSSEGWKKKINVAETILTAIQDSNLGFEFDDYEYFMLMDELDKLLKEKLDINSAVEKEVKEREDNYKAYIEAMESGINK